MRAPVTGKQDLRATAPTAAVFPNIIIAAVRNFMTRQSSTVVGNVANESANEGNTMNWDMIKGDWMQFRGEVKEQWGRLTDDNLDRIAGVRDRLSGKIQETYGVTKEQVELQVKAFEEIHKDYQPKTTV